MTEGKEELLMGYLNINLMSSTPNPRFLQSLSRELSLTQMITEPTRVTQNSATLIGHIYVSDPDPIMTLVVWTLALVTT